MAFKIENFGSEVANAKSILGGICYYRYFNEEGDDLTLEGFFPSNLGLKFGDRICVIPADVTYADAWYGVTNVDDNGVVTVGPLTAQE